MSERGDARAHEAALMLLSDPSPNLRRKAAVILGKVRFARTLPSLIVGSFALIVGLFCFHSGALSL